MEIKFLGTWWYDDLHCGNSAAMMYHPEWNILLDCGASIYERIRKNNLQDDIDYVLLTHLHGDHMWWLFSLIAHFGVVQKRKMKILYTDNNFKALIIRLLILWYDDNRSEKVEFISIDTDTYLYHCDHLKKPDDCNLPCVANIQKFII